MSTTKTRILPEALRRTYDDVDELLARIVDFVSGITWTDQDGVMEQREPVRWKLALLLDSSGEGHDTTNPELRMLMLRLELEALLQNQDVLVNVARRFHEQLLAVAPDLPTLTVAQEER